MKFYWIGENKMTQTIKPNDLVYIPSLSNKLQKVDNNMTIDDGYNRYVIDEYGRKNDFDTGKYHTQPFAFLATAKNKEKLEQVYGELEAIPVDEELENFYREINLLLNAQKELSSMIISTDYSQPDSSQTKRTNIATQILYHKENLIRMFKERGANE